MIPLRCDRIILHGLTSPGAGVVFAPATNLAAHSHAQVSYKAFSSRVAAFAQIRIAEDRAHQQDGEGFHPAVCQRKSVNLFKEATDEQYPALYGTCVGLPAKADHDHPRNSSWMPLSLPRPELSERARRRSGLLPVKRSNSARAGAGRSDAGESTIAGTRQTTGAAWARARGNSQRLEAT